MRAFAQGIVVSGIASAATAASAAPDDFGGRWSKVTLIPTIADRDGREVPYSYAAMVD